MQIHIINRIFALLVVTLCVGHNLSFAIETTSEVKKHPDYAREYLGEDKYEKFNRKVFTFNTGLNKYAIRPVHILWASVMPKCGMDMIQSAYVNIEYPKRLASTLLQKDFAGAKNETLRFVTNSTLGLGGIFDPAKRYFGLEPLKEDMGQALAKMKVKQGPYLVVPIIQSSTPRDLAGKALEIPLDPSIYVASPVTAIVKAGLLVNRTSYMQPFSKMLESTYADPYDVMKKLYGIESYIKNNNLDRQTDLALAVETDLNQNSTLEPDIILDDYNPQAPIIDSMRTALFELPEIRDSIWTELSLWNRSFANRIKTSSLNLYPGRDDYKYRYILQKNKTSPIAIIHPSTGEGITSHHCEVLAKLFWDEGFSVIIEGSSLNWEFVKSMPEDYRPGIPSQDADCLRFATSKIFDSLKSKHGCEPCGKVLIGTSFGAATTLFLADKESRDNSLNISKYIAINPPIEMLFAINQIDKHSEELSEDSVAQKEKIAAAAAKVIKLSQIKDNNGKIETMPFSQSEAKLITNFIMRQKLSDLIFTIENAPKTKKTDIYETISSLSYGDYVQKYLLKEDRSLEELDFEASLHSIADFLKSNNNYRIYHTPDDYFVNTQQLKQLKEYSGNQTTLISNGSHMGFLYRKEFIDELKREITSEGAKQEL